MEGLMVELGFVHFLAMKDCRFDTQSEREKEYSFNS